jgi:hypothetical protein
LPSSKTPLNSSSTSSKKRDFSTTFLDAKENEIQFKKECFQLELAFKQKEFDIKQKEIERGLELKLQELELKRQELSNDKSKDIIKALISQGKTADEVKEFLNILKI